MFDWGLFTKEKMVKMKYDYNVIDASSCCVFLLN